jgi:hypothetical protein
MGQLRREHWSPLRALDAAYVGDRRPGLDCIFRVSPPFRKSGNLYGELLFTAVCSRNNPNLIAWLIIFAGLRT